MRSQNNIKPTDVLTNLWHMFVYSGFPCPQFSRLCSPEDLSIFINVRVNTGGEIGINSQRRNRLTLQELSQCPLKCTSIPETALTHTPTVPYINSNGREANTSEEDFESMNITKASSKNICSLQGEPISSSRDSSQTCTPPVTCTHRDKDRGAITVQVCIYGEN